MIFNVIDVNSCGLEAQFYERNKAKAYIDIHDPKREKLFILETKTAADYFFSFYNVVYESGIFLSKLGGAYFC